MEMLYRELWCYIVWEIGNKEAEAIEYGLDLFFLSVMD